MPQNVKELFQPKNWVPHFVSFAMLLFAIAHWKAKMEMAFKMQEDVLSRHERSITFHSEKIQAYDVVGTQFSQRMNSMTLMQSDALQRRLDATDAMMQMMRENNSKITTDIKWIRETLDKMQK